jgi:hypothetical protein
VGPFWVMLELNRKPDPGADEGLTGCGSTEGVGTGGIEEPKLKAGFGGSATSFSGGLKGEAVTGELPKIDGGAATSLDELSCFLVTSGLVAPKEKRG